MEGKRERWMKERWKEREECKKLRRAEGKEGGRRSGVGKEKEKERERERERRWKGRSIYDGDRQVRNYNCNHMT